MRVLIFFLFPFLAFSANSQDIDLSYSIQGEKLVMTWSTIPQVDHYKIESGTNVTRDGAIQYNEVHKASTSNKFQLTYSDESIKPATIIYYRVTGYDKHNEKVCGKTFTANFTNKDSYILNINPNFFANILEFEINSKDAGNAAITIENLKGSFKSTKSIDIKSGYNNFTLDINGNESDKLIVQVDYADRTTYRMLDIKSSSPVITSDE